MDNEKLEILMGKFFDGEIEPSEKRLLDAHLAKDPLNRRLFEEFQMLHIQAQAELACLADQGQPFESILPLRGTSAAHFTIAVSNCPAERFVLSPAWPPVCCWRC